MHQQAVDAEAPRITLVGNIWVAVPIVALIAAIQSDSRLLLNYVHVFTAILWTGTDIFMGFVLGPILRRLDLPVRRAIVSRLMPRMLLYVPTMAAVTTTAGFYLAFWRGLFALPLPDLWWVIATLGIVAAMFIQGFGILLPTNLRVFFELRKTEPDLERIGRLMRLYTRVIASQATLQFVIIFIMAWFATLP